MIHARVVAVENIKSATGDNMGSTVINGKLIEDPINFQKTDNDLTKLRIEESRKLFQQNGNARQYVRTEQKIGRNDPCPCGSGKKFKKCHGG